MQSSALSHNLCNLLKTKCQCFRVKKKKPAILKVIVIMKLIWVFPLTEFSSDDWWKARVLIAGYIQ